MADFTRKNRGLELTFPVSGLAVHEPGFLSDTVQLVHPAFGPLARIGVRERQYLSQSFVNTGIKLVGVAVPERTVRVIEFAQLSHDSAVARHLVFGIANDNFAGTGVMVENTRQEGAGSVYALGEIFCLKHAISLGPGDQFVVRALGAADAAMNVDVIYAMVDYTAADEALVR